MIYGCIGEHLPHSFSKEIHNRIGDYDYVLHEIPMGELDAFMRAKDFKAINVTIPFKQAVIPYLDEIDERAKAIGAVNTIVNNDGKLYGYNTDFLGMTDLINKIGISLKNRKVLILGTGGTSKTANAVAESMGAKKIITVSRKRTDKFIDYDEAIANHKNAEIIINTTPCGMYPNIDFCPIDISPFSNLEGAIDAIYNPLRTNFILNCKSRNIKAEGGLYMLVAQAVRAYEIFFDTLSEKGLTDKIYNDLFSEKENIVLTGMPGSGKSSVGKALAEKLQRKFIDTDEIIVKNAGMPITEIFEKYGEVYFRELETKAILEASKYSNAVISTGGGAILKDKNISLLKMNGKIYFLDRSLEKLLPSDDRPLASTRQAITKRYDERIDRYNQTADVKINSNVSVEEVAAEIERRHTK
jgi:shikimate dehydrogenase